MKLRLFSLSLITVTFFMVGCRKLPLVGFTPSAFTISAGDSVVFTNTSRNAASYLWDFGDSTESTLKSPVHFYDSEGVYTVKLSAYSKGKQVTSSRTEDISVE